MMTATPGLAPIARSFLIGGTLGWLIEAVGHKPRFPSYLPGIPFLPLYGAGAALVTVLRPQLEGVGPFGRFATYAVVLGALEIAGGTLECCALGQASWDYGDGRLTDIKHAALWGGLALLAEPLLAPQPKRAPRSSPSSRSRASRPRAPRSGSAVHGRSLRPVHQTLVARRSL